MKWHNPAPLLFVAALMVGCGSPPAKKTADEPIVINTEDPAGDGSVVVETDEVETDEHEVQIELTWNTPSDPDQADDDGTDLDLHFRHPSGTWNEAPHDIFWGNRTADWGAPGAEDDPILEIEDFDGLGPELISYSGMLTDALFDVAVYYAEDRGFGASFATVRVYRHGEVVFQRDTRLEPGEFWLVGRISAEQVLLVDAVTSEMPHH